MEQADPEGGGVDSAVVDRRQRRRPPTEPIAAPLLVFARSAADFVEDLPGLLAGLDVEGSSLPARQRAKCAQGEVGAER